MQTKDLKERYEKFCEEQGWKCYRAIPCPVCDTWFFIQSAIEEREKEIFNRITRHKSHEEIGTREWYKDKLNHVQKALSELSKKEE